MGKFDPRRSRTPRRSGPVAESAAWLLEHGDPSLVRRCENDRCVLVFYDTTKNRRRRQCTMETCGSRAKSAADYRRKRRGR
ncbi:MAG: CGNR zinc finger domain-containing protein [Myxococcales bacterium]